MLARNPVERESPMIEQGMAGTPSGLIASRGCRCPPRGSPCGLAYSPNGCPVGLVFLISNIQENFKNYDVRYTVGVDNSQAMLFFSKKHTVYCSFLCILQLYFGSFLDGRGGALF